MTELNQGVQRWQELARVGQEFLEPIRTETELEAAEELLEPITNHMKTPNDPLYIGLFRIVAQRIWDWENQHIPSVHVSILPRLLWLGFIFAPNY